MVHQKIAIASVLVFLNWSMGSSAWGQPPIAKRTCEPIGRVLSAGDRTLTPGSLLCSGDRLHLASNQTVRVLCYLNQKVLLLQNGGVSDAPDKCVSLLTPGERCTPQSPKTCPKTKGPDFDENVPALINPYSSNILDPRPKLSWFSVPKATSYTVQINGKGVNWTQDVLNTWLPYPQEQPELQLGNVYKVSVIANRGNSPTNASSTILIMSTELEIQQILYVIWLLRNLNLSPDDLAMDLDTTYMTQNLLSEAINVLQARIKAGTQNPTLYRALGDRYLEAGLPVKAKLEYTKAAQLAQKVDNAVELVKARAGLKRAQIYTQLPSNS